MPIKKKFLYLALALLFTCLNTSMAYGSVSDSLKLLLENEKNDSLRISILNELSYELSERDPNQALYYAEKAVELANKIDSEFGLMRSWGQMGNAFRKLKNFPKAIECYIKGEKIAEKLNDSYRMSALGHNIGLLYQQIKQYDKAVKFLLKAVEIDRSTKDELSLAISLNSLGATYLDNNKFDKAKEVLKESTELFLKTGNKIRASSAFRNLGIIEGNLKNYPSAIKYYEKAIELYILQDQHIKAGECLRMISKINTVQNNSDKAIFYYEQSLKYAPVITQNELDGNNIMYFIAEAYMKKGQKEKAYATLQLGYQCYEQFFNRLDSIKAFERDKAFAEMATKYDTEKTEKENRINQLENDYLKEADARNQIVIYSFVIGAILLIGFLFMAVRSNILTKKASKKIRAQKEQIEIQHDEISLKNREITSSIEYAKSLQDAILPDLSYIDKFLPHNFILWLPRDIVSGDFYWFFEHDNKFFFAAADCTGHGVPGAFVSMTCHNILNQIVIDQHEDDPGNILHKVHLAISNVFRKEGTLTKANDGMDVALLCIEPSKKLISYSGAMNDLVQISGSELITHKADRYAIGGRTPIDFQFQTKKINYTSGDWFYMFSDGFKDQFGGPHRKKYMNANFLKLLQTISVDEPKVQKEKLQQELIDWAAGFERIDDVLVVGFRV